MPRVKGHMIEGRRDANHADVVRWYEQHGCTVIDLSTVGGGVSDLLIGCAGITDLCEVKTLDGSFNDRQIGFNARWRGSQPWKSTTLDDVNAHVAHMRARARLLGKLGRIPP